GRVYERANRNRPVYHPAPVLVAQSSQQQEEEQQMQPRPDPAHSFEIPEEAVRGRWRQHSGERSCRKERNKCVENRLVVKIERSSAEAEREDKGRYSALHDDTEENVSWNYVRK